MRVARALDWGADHVGDVLLAVFTVAAIGGVIVGLYALLSNL